MIDDTVKIQIKEKIKKLHYSAIIRAIIGYGSWIRGDYGEDSDIDILVIVETGFNINQHKLEEIFVEIATGRVIDLAIYDAKKFETVLTCGSLFLHHVKDEGEILYARKGFTKEYLFGKLNDFKGISEDILLYQRMFVKARNSIETNGINYYDLNILSLLARNTQILICYQNEEPTYGKWQVYDKCKDLIGKQFTLSTDVYNELLMYRNYFNRKSNRIALPNGERYQIYFEEVGALIELGISLFGVHNAIDRIYFILADGVGRNLYTSYEVFSDFDRDVFIYINRYLTNRYNTTIDSIRSPFLLELVQKYPDDEFIQCVCNVVEEVKNVKKQSSNYAIDVPDVYSEIHFKNTFEHFETIFSFEEGTIGKKIIDLFISKCGGKRRKNMLQMLEEMRNYIETLELQ